MTVWNTNSYPLYWVYVRYYDRSFELAWKGINDDAGVRVLSYTIEPYQSRISELARKLATVKKGLKVG